MKYQGAIHIPKITSGSHVSTGYGIGGNGKIGPIISTTNEAEPKYLPQTTKAILKNNVFTNKKENNSKVMIYGHNNFWRVDLER